MCVHGFKIVFFIFSSLAGLDCGFHINGITWSGPWTISWSSVLPCHGDSSNTPVSLCSNYVLSALLEAWIFLRYVCTCIHIIKLTV